MARKTTASLFALAICALMLAPTTANATDIPVTTIMDVSADDSVCSLREAIQAAQTNTAIGTVMAPTDCPAGQSGADDVVQLQAMTYAIASTTSMGGASEDLNANGDFDLNFTGGTQGPLVIDGTLGPGEVPTSIINAADLDRIFDVQNGDTPNLTIQQVILRNGKPPETSSDGGAILIRDDNANFELNTARVEDSDALDWGGGMANLSGVAGLDIDINQVEFSGNDATGKGGAIWADGPQTNNTFQIRRSAFINNHTDQMGGAIYIRQTADITYDEAVVEVYNSTITGNTADVTGGAVAFAFGLEGSLWTSFSTYANNSTIAPMGTGGIATTTGGVDEFILGTGNILANNTANAGATPANCNEPLEFSGGSGVETGPMACFPTATTIANPLLGTLAYDPGGDLTTRSFPLGAGSPAVDKVAVGSCNLAEGVDQRGVARPIGAGCDAGAFEAPLPATTPATPGTPATPTATPAKVCPVKKKKKKKKRSASAAKKKKKKKKKKC